MAFEVESRTNNEAAVRAATVIAQRNASISIASTVSPSASWIGFGLSSAISRTVVHFFPSAGSVTAPYAANCKLAVFGVGVERRSVNLEGARVSQPDGVRLDDIFSGLRDSSGPVFGIEIEVSTMQQRVDLSSSGCVVELVYGAQSVRFFPHPAIQQSTGSGSPLLIQDGLMNSSVVVVNHSSTPTELNLGIAESISIPTGVIAAGSVKEIQIGAEISAKLQQIDCSWGTLRAAPLEIAASATSVSDIYAYLMYRDTVTRQPISVTRIPCLGVNA